MKLFFSGILIGIGKILPGISGSLLAIRLGIYEKVMDAILYFFKKPKENLFFLGTLCSGFLLSTIIGSKVLLQLFLKYGIFLKIIFILVIVTGIPDILKKGKSFPITIISFLLTSTLFLLPKGNFPVSYFAMGIIETFSTIIPGISGTAIFLSLGWYEEVLSLFGELYLLPFARLIPFTLGLVISGYFLIKMMNYLFRFYSGYTYSAILGFLLSSLFFVF